MERYLEEADVIKPFYRFSPSLKGISEAAGERQFSPRVREILVAELEKQYADIDTGDAVKAHISALKDEHTFTVCTGHQLSLFTGPLFFIYKI